MIRLVATDMDGTLLDGNRELPPDFDEVMKQLWEKDIYFAIASGRSYATLKQQFCKHIKELVFICDNGANVMYQQKCLNLSVIAQPHVEEVIRFCREIGGKLLLCGTRATYHEYFGTEEAEDEIAHYYVNQVLIKDNLLVQDDIFKIAIYDEEMIEQHIYPALRERFGQRLNIQISGAHWIDVMNPEVSKGAALQTIQAKLGISREETMAFGDYLNDYELLLEAKESYAMANAHDKLKEIAAHIAPSNQEQGVMKVIHRELL